MAVICKTVEEALAPIKSGDRVWCHSMAATPYRLLEALAVHVLSLENVTLLQLHLEHEKRSASPNL